MKITKEISLEDFEAWSGAKSTLDELTSDECEQLEAILEDMYPDGMDETTLNDILWFEEDAVADWLGYKDWEHLKRDHAGEADEDYAREVLNEEYPCASEGLKQMFEDFIDEEWTSDMTKEEILDAFKDYREQNDKEE